jgi:hypothetical protein
MQTFLVYPNFLVLILVLLWFISSITIYKHSEPKELNKKGLHFEIAGVAILTLIYINNSLKGMLLGEELLVIAPVVISRFFIASEIVHYKRR